MEGQLRLFRCAVFRRQNQCGFHLIRSLFRCAGKHAFRCEGQALRQCACRIHLEVYAFQNVKVRHKIVQIQRIHFLVICQLDGIAYALGKLDLHRHFLHDDLGVGSQCVWAFCDLGFAHIIVIGVRIVGRFFQGDLGAGVVICCHGRRIFAKAFVIGHFQTVDLLGIGVQRGILLGGKILVECNGGLVTVQQVADFAAGELVCSFECCAVEIIGFAIGEVVAVFNCAIFIINLNYTIHTTACKRSRIVAIFNCAARIIPGGYSSASILISCNISSVITIYN